MNTFRNILLSIILGFLAFVYAVSSYAESPSDTYYQTSKVGLDHHYYDLWNVDYLGARYGKFRNLEVTDTIYVPSSTQNISNSAISNITSAAIIGGVSVPDVFNGMKEPTGFEDRSTSTISYVTGTVNGTFTITGTHVIYIKGVKYTKSTASATVATATGLTYVYYNSSGTLTSSQDFPGFFVPLISSIYMNPRTGQYILNEERHGCTMDGDTHAYEHVVNGAQYGSGLVLTVGSGTFSTTAGTFLDEDITTDIAAQTKCNLLYRAFGVYVFDASQTALYKMSGTNIMYSNNGVATAASSNKYVAYWIFATNNAAAPIVSLMGQREDTTLAEAQANNTYASLTFATLPSLEMKVLYRVIYRNTGAIPTWSDTTDLRTSPMTGNASFVATAHSQLSGNTPFESTGHNDSNFSVVAGVVTSLALNTGTSTVATMTAATANAQNSYVTSIEVHATSISGIANTQNSYVTGTEVHSTSISGAANANTLNVTTSAWENAATIPTLTAGTASTTEALTVGTNLLFSVGNNVSILSGALASRTTANYNNAIGVGALYGATDTNTTHNNAMGYNALYHGWGGYNNAFGMNALKNNLGSYNNAFGLNALYTNTTGNHNHAMGYYALFSNTTGTDCLGLGSSALYSNTTGNNLVAMGSSAGYDNTIGGNNTYLGYNTGRGITSGNYNTIVGANVTGLSSSLSNNIILADGQGNQRINVDASGNVIIGGATATPAKILTVIGGGWATLGWSSPSISSYKINIDPVTSETEDRLIDGLRNLNTFLFNWKPEPKPELASIQDATTIASVTEVVDVSKEETVSIPLFSLPIEEFSDIDVMPDYVSTIPTNINDGSKLNIDTMSYEFPIIVDATDVVDATREIVTKPKEEIFHERTRQWEKKTSVIQKHKVAGIMMDQQKDNELLKLFAAYDEEGNLVGKNDSEAIGAILTVLKKQQKKIDQLEQQIAKLTADCATAIQMFKNICPGTDIHSTDPGFFEGAEQLKGE